MCRSEEGDASRGCCPARKVAEETRLGSDAGFCHPCPCAKSLILGPWAHLSPGGICMWGSSQPCSPSGDSSMGHGNSSLDAHDHYLFHISQSRCTHVHACTQQLQTGHYSMSTVTHPNLHYWLGWRGDEIRHGASWFTFTARRRVSPTSTSGHPLGW